MTDIIINFFVQVLLSVGVILIFGSLIAFCNKTFYSNIGYRSNALCIATGFIGTPIHELSHALFCVIFRHKINEIKLFTIGSDGTLGYVSHSYNRRNIYQRIGNFFIGVGPILGISAVILLIAKLFLPDLPTEILAQSQNYTPQAGILSAFEGIANSLIAFFSYIGSPKWWIFIAISMLLSLHMTLSKADLHGVADGLLFLLPLLLLIDTIIGLISPNVLYQFTGIFYILGGFLCSFMAMALLISIVTVLISYIIKPLLR